MCCWKALQGMLPVPHPCPTHWPLSVLHWVSWSILHICLRPLWMQGLCLSSPCMAHCRCSRCVGDAGQEGDMAFLFGSLSCRGRDCMKIHRLQLTGRGYHAHEQGPALPLGGAESSSSSWCNVSHSFITWNNDLIQMIHYFFVSQRIFGLWHLDANLFYI